VIYGLYSLDKNDISQCQKDFEQAARQKPALEKLDAAGQRYAEALAALGTSVMDVHFYYEREDYKDDNFSKGKASHAGLVKTMRAFMDASETFSQLLDEENDKILTAQLAEIEKTEGRKSNYWRMSLMMQARRLVDVISDEDFPVDVATARLESFEKVADEAGAYAKAHEDELSQLGSMIDMEMSVEDFRKASKERLRRIRDKEPYTRGEQMNLGGSSSWMVRGSQGKVIWAYNKLVDASNRSR
jgi:hypothetical protein